ncbi:hypothetical protein EJ08DRAFT_644945 [Tothia fuscella]|uniref:Phosphoglycerate mutase n=1 Tax=Tothia fuscella TaxID=1048955 RepID=A0A9P4P499_9PEZI|nr:hypothetical protein EJ08DRAFT_644945 [Tothia fuscella]
MTRAPSVIIVVRHGARMDAADRHWHLSSPAPYDPPLTYGGWNQSKALGSRIASVLDARAQALELDGIANITEPHNETAQRRRKRREQKVVIHSSPFLRCLQTSVAIAAGMAQSENNARSRQRHQPGCTTKSQKSQLEPPSGNQEKFVLDQEDENVFSKPTKPILRVDAFLGEWLSQESFEHITAPPDSTMMIATAKAQLLRHDQIQVFQPSTLGNGHFPGGWSLARRPKLDSQQVVSAIHDRDELSSSSSLNVPYSPHRASSHSSTGETSIKAGHWGAMASHIQSCKTRYNPPIPAYAVAPSDAIPRGYCTHAREECMDIDIHWDSMRQPQDWGDGGMLGEEWSLMHKRFRFGLNKMISWYKEHSPDFRPEREDPLAFEHDDGDDEDHEEYDLVLVLVTHSAGCNALVGALSNHPVLMDFGMSSLSMAVRTEDTNSSSSTGRRRSSVDFGPSEEYEVKIMGSTGHLRAGAEATKVAALQSPHLVPQIPEFRVTQPRISQQGPGSVDKSKRYGELKKLPNSMSSALGSIRRTTNTPSNTYRNSSRSPVRSPRSRSSSGLWSKAPTAASSVDDEIQDLSIGPPAADTRPESSDSDTPLPTGFRKFSDRYIEDSTPRPGGLGRSLSQHGLWGPKPAAIKTEAELGIKRRWSMAPHTAENDSY